jgi:hypothetical protein
MAHPASGNGYAFLSLYRATGEERFLSMAQASERSNGTPVTSPPPRTCAPPRVPKGPLDVCVSLHRARRRAADTPRAARRPPPRARLQAFALFAAERWEELYNAPDRPASLFEVGSVRGRRESPRFRSSCKECALGQRSQADALRPSSPASLGPSSPDLPL